MDYIPLEGILSDSCHNISLKVTSLTIAFSAILTLKYILHTAGVSLGSLGKMLASLDSTPYSLYRVHRIQTVRNSTYFYHTGDQLHTTERIKFYVNVQLIKPNFMTFIMKGCYHILFNCWAKVHQELIRQ